MTPQAFRAANPHLFFLDPADLSGANAYLTRRQLLHDGESIVRLEPAGDGNMNCTLRAFTQTRTLIIKQARPWVEKYPQFAAPWDRVLREADFYRLAATRPDVNRFLPKLLAADAESRVLVLEDLGQAGDYTGIYRGETLSGETVLHLADFLSSLHGAFDGDPHPPQVRNQEMRQLNHAHIFAIPLQEDNRLDLDTIQPGLQAAANRLKASTTYRNEVARLGSEVYLADGPTLIHGDFFPGSLIRTAQGPRVIDPEFCYSGRPEYDVGVFLAHLFLGAQPIELWLALRARYHAPRGFEDRLVHQIAGVEIMRRLIGYAQLPLIWGFQARLALLKLSHDLVLQPDQALAHLPVAS
jgi:5-methylthioribose kinase